MHVSLSLNWTSSRDFWHTYLEIWISRLFVVSLEDQGSSLVPPTMLISYSFFISSENSWVRTSIVEPNAMSSTYTWATTRYFSSRLTKSVQSAWPLLKPWSRRYDVRQSYHALGACFSPYKAFFNRSTWFGKWGSWNPFGCSTNTSSCKISFKNALFASIW